MGLLIIVGLLVLLIGALCNPLYYVVASIPLYLYYRSGSRSGLRVGLAILVIAAFAPALWAQAELWRLTKGSSASPVVIHPGTYLLTDEFTGAAVGPGPKLCQKLCQELLYNGHVSAVYATQLLPEMPSTAFSHAFHPGTLWEYRLEQRTFCPGGHSQIEPEFENMEASGLCLIETSVDRADFDVAVTMSAISFDECDYTKPRTTSFLVDMTKKTTTTIYESVNDRWALAEVRASLEARGPALPFYFGTAHHCGMMSFGPEPAIAWVPRNAGDSDPARILERRYGLKLTEATSQAQ